MTYKGVHGLVGGLPRFKAIIHLVCPRSHLNSPNEYRIDVALLVKARKQRGKMLANKMGFCASSRIHGGKGQATDRLSKGQRTT